MSNLEAMKSLIQEEAIKDTIVDQLMGLANTLVETLDLEEYKEKWDEFYEKIKQVPGTDEEKYQMRKNLSNGLMDFALLAANNNQLKKITESSDHPFSSINNMFVSASLFFQAIVLVLTLLNASYPAPKVGDVRNIVANFLTNLITIGVFAISLINVFAVTFRVPLSNSYSTEFNQTEFY